MNSIRSHDRELDNERIVIDLRPSDLSDSPGPSKESTPALADVEIPADARESDPTEVWWNSINLKELQEKVSSQGWGCAPKVPYKTRVSVPKSHDNPKAQHSQKLQVRVHTIHMLHPTIDL